MMMCSVLLCILLLSVCLCVGSWQLSASSSAKSALWTLAGKRAQLSSSRLYDSQYDKPTDREETREEMIERLRKKARKMMYNEKGVPFAPWMSKQIDEDVIIELLIKKEQGVKAKPATSTLDKGEIETSEGMIWRMKDSQVDLGWVTGNEADNQGFIVEKRPSYGGDFREVASFREVGSLRSKGPTGGRYKFTDPSTVQGSWIYRVKDCDNEGNQNILCQCFVEVQTEAESKTQSALAVGFVAVLAAAAAAGYILDPPL